MGKPNSRIGSRPNERSWYDAEGAGAKESPRGRLAARVLDLSQDGHVIAKGAIRDLCRVYKLEPSAPICSPIIPITLISEERHIPSPYEYEAAA